MSFFQLSEVKDRWFPPKSSYPTWHQVLRMYQSCTYVKGIGDTKRTKLKTKDALREIAKFLYDVWESGDGLPKTEKHIIQQIETELLPTYFLYRRGEGRMKGKKRKKRIDSDVHNQPKRRSSCHGRSVISDEGTEKLIQDPSLSSGADSAGTGNTQIGKQVPRATRNQTATNECKNEWMEDFGWKMFDIRSNRKYGLFVNDHKNELKMSFDSLFYEDQQKPLDLRTKTIEFTRVTKEYLLEQKAIQLSEARKYSRRVLALGSSHIEDSDNEEELNVNQVSSQSDSDGVDDDEFSPVSHTPPQTTVLSVESRSKSEKLSIPKTFSECSVQVEEYFLPDESFPKTSTRKEHTKSIDDELEHYVGYAGSSCDIYH